MFHKINEIYLQSADLYVAAKLLSNRCYILGNGHGVILNVSPLKKAVVFYY